MKANFKESFLRNLYIFHPFLFSIEKGILTVFNLELFGYSNVVYFSYW